MRAVGNRSALVRVLGGSAALAGLVWAATVVAQQMPGEKARPSPEINPPGPQIARATSGPSADDASIPLTPSTPAAKSVQDLLSRAVTDATTPGKRADLVGLFASRDRINGAAPGSWSDVDAAAEALQNAWQARFGTRFDVAGMVPLVFTEPSVHVSGLDDGGASTEHGGTNGVPQVSLTDPGRRSTAIIRLAKQGAGDNAWRIDLPDSATAATLHDSLLTHLRAVTANQARWPTDIDQAYVYVAQHVLSSIAEAGTMPRP